MTQPQSSTRPNPVALVAGGFASALLLAGAAVFLAPAGCGNSTDGAAVAASSSGAAPAAKPSGGSLPDLTKEFESGQCEEIKGSAVPGADSYFHGTFEMDGEMVRGHESWWLAANKAWEGAGGTSCSIRWSVTGTKVATGACTDCDFGLKLSGTPEPGASKCPEQLLKREVNAEAHAALLTQLSTEL